ncbi:MAG: hypothetical protein PWR19_2280 [Carnobacterium sp.]|uniref:hypothetical protein n=1 Tax=Carnobacterium sp. TaxID=48221 RepID=UPI002648D087|nr:hypothetical protein [Carnobacterium sp.]MDN5373233.1 hypothetical protein [Carnobacterium sp.]
MAKKGTVILIEELLFNYEGIEGYITDHLNRKEYRPNRYAFTIYDDLMITNLRQAKYTIRSILNDIEPLPYKVIELHYLKNRQLKEVAETLDCTLKECKNYKAIIIAEIAKHLGLLI